MAEAPSLLDRLGRVWQLADYVVASCYDDHGNLAYGLGDGSIYLVPAGTGEPVSVAVHRGACLCLAAAPQAGFLSGGEDGKLVHISPHGDVVVIRNTPGRWVDHVASHPDGALACSAGKQVYLRRPDSSEVELEHPSTAGGLCFSPDGRQLAVSHYGGVSLHYTLATTARPKRLKWTGSHLAVSWSPDGRFLLTCMQENCIRGWRLKDAEDLHMSGYPARIKSWAWIDQGRWLATAAVDCVPCWPFKKRSGPMGESPLTLAARDHAAVTVVAGDPLHPLLAVGYEDGMVLVVELDEEALVPRSIAIKPPGQGAVSCLAFAPDGTSLSIGTSRGFSGIMPMA